MSNPFDLEFSTSDLIGLSFEDLIWKTIEDVAGGDVQRYANMMIADMKARGANFPPEDGVPANGDLVGDKLPGYANVNLGAKIWSWLTRKQRGVIDGQIIEEIQEQLHLKEAKKQTKLDKPAEDSGKK